MKVLKFSATWCGPCKSLSGILEQYYSGGVEIQEIDIDENKDAVAEYGIRGVPTCVLLDDDGKEIRRKSGVMMIDEFNEFIGE